MTIKHRVIVLILGLAVCLGAQAVEKKPLEHFFKKAQYSGFQLSPDGTRIGVLAPVNGRMNLAVMNVDLSDARLVTQIEEQDVNGFIWANNERLIFFMDDDGNESFGMFAVNADGSEPRTLHEPASAQIRAGQRAAIRYVRPINLLRDDKDNILVISNERRAPYPDVYTMDIYSGKKKLVQRNLKNVDGWFTDYDGNLIGASLTDGLENAILMRNPETDEYEELIRTRYDEPSFTPAGMKGDGENGWVSSYLTPDGQGRDKAAIYEYNFKTREFGDLVFEHPKVDVSGISLSEKTRDIVSVTYTYDKPVTKYLDPRWKQAMDGINQALPDTLNFMSSMDREETKGVVVSYSSQQPPEYYLYDMDGRKLTYLAASRPWVDPGEMAKTTSFTMQARDGMEMQGYLTLPPGSDGKNLPTIVHPHGGPWARDGYGFNPEVQFLANRGYAVIQVNFRGSTGFGMEHMMSSRKQWGRAMQDDISDALKWAVDQGISDPDQVCIYGASYGGFATMAGLTFSPELYKCGINYVGVTDLVVFQETTPDAWASGEEFIAEMVGDRKEEKEFLEQWSPAKNAGRIQAPLLMAYGKQDPRVHIDNLTVMEKALKKAGKKEGKDFWTIVKKDEGHGFRKQENQLEFYGEMEEFLARYIGP